MTAFGRSNSVAGFRLIAVGFRLIDEDIVCSAEAHCVSQSVLFDTTVMPRVIPVPDRYKMLGSTVYTYRLLRPY